MKEAIHDEVEAEIHIHVHGPVKGVMLSRAASSEHHSMNDVILSELRAAFQKGVS